MRTNPFLDTWRFALALHWPSLVFWLLLIGAAAGAGRAWRLVQGQANGSDLGRCFVRVIIGGMWWQQSLWKFDVFTNPHFAKTGLGYWMEQMVKYASFPIQSRLVGDFVLPNGWFFGPLVYFIEAAIGAALILGFATRTFALIGALMAANLWLGLYRMPSEWPWTYAFLLAIQLIYVFDPPGRSLGWDANMRAENNRRGGVLDLIT